MPTVTIDGQTIEVEPGATIIEAADLLGIFIPRFCYHPKLSVVAQCRQCMVEIQEPAPPPGAPPRPFTACSTPVAEGMVVSTKSEVAIQAQKAVVEFLLLNHPLDCPICDQGGECPLQDITMGFGESLTRNEFVRRTYPKLDISAFIEPEMNRCVHCTRCIRFSDEIDGASEFGFVERGDRTMIDTYHDLDVSVKSTVSGNVIDICPVGALTNKPYRFKARVWEMESTETPCLLCPVQCQSKVWTRENDIKRVTAGHNEAVNETWICDAGRWGMEFVCGSNRLKTPSIGPKENPSGNTWEECLTHVVEGFRKVGESHGAEAIAGIGGSRSTNEAAYLFQKFLRGALGTNHVDARTRLLDIAGTDGFNAERGFPGISLNFESLETAPSAFLFGSDLFYEHPILAVRLRKAIKAGASLVIAHPRHVSINTPVAVRLAYTPGAERALMFGLWCALCEVRSDLVLPAEAESSIEDYAELANVRARDLRFAAEILGGAPGCAMLMGPGIGDPSAAISFASLEAALPNAKGGYLHTGANLQGAMDMGCLPYALPGYRPVCLDKGPLETDGKYPNWEGLNTNGIIEGIQEGRIRALYLLNADPLRECLTSDSFHEAISNLDFLVVHDSLPNACAEFADVVLPSRTATEVEGTVTGLGHQVQTLSVALRPKFSARPEWEVFLDLMELMGSPHCSGGLRDVQEEIVRAVPGYAGLTRVGVGDEGFQWNSEGIVGGNLKVPSPLLKEISASLPGSSELKLMTSPQLFASGPMVAESRAIQSAGPQAYAELHPDSAKAISLTDGDFVILSSERGRVPVTVRVNRKTPPGAVYLPSEAGQSCSNALLSPEDLVPIVEMEPADALKVLPG